MALDAETQFLRMDRQKREEILVALLSRTRTLSELSDLAQKLFSSAGGFSGNSEFPTDVRRAAEPSSRRTPVGPSGSSGPSCCSRNGLPSAHGRKGAFSEDALQLLRYKLAYGAEEAGRSHHEVFPCSVASAGPSALARRSPGPSRWPLPPAREREGERVQDASPEFCELDRRANACSSFPYFFSKSREVREDNEPRWPKPVFSDEESASEDQQTTCSSVASTDSLKSRLLPAAILRALAQPLRPQRCAYEEEDAHEVPSFPRSTAPEATYTSSLALLERVLAELPATRRSAAVSARFEGSERRNTTAFAAPFCDREAGATARGKAQAVNEELRNSGDEWRQERVPIKNEREVFSGQEAALKLGLVQKLSEKWEEDSVHPSPPASAANPRPSSTGKRSRPPPFISHCEDGRSSRANGGFELDAELERGGKRHASESLVSQRPSLSRRWAWESDPEFVIDDPATWTKDSTAKYIDDLILHGPPQCDFTNFVPPLTNRRRFSLRELFLTIGGRRQDRKWMLYSQQADAVFCFPCLLYSPRVSKFVSDGFCLWRNQGKRYREHETSSEHRAAVMKLDMRRKALTEGCVLPLQKVSRRSGLFPVEDHGVCAKRAACCVLKET
uniref:TTF-type domain-containing protein n=1 Tax=Toxoplasma gondii TgCATBr9 TaxID=943120 RepID=A0A2T6IZL6_TOXGO|nr:hypothetical protein TGBR9_249410 [Toxoplasma gondii TgCATBr9]